MVKGVGLGYRREMVSMNKEILSANIDYVEVAPENWMRMNSLYQKPLKELTENIPLSTHGLSLSLGSPDPLDIEFVKNVKSFLDAYNVESYSEHLSYCSSNGHVYDLMPIPFTYDAARYVAKRIQHVQDILERKIAIENVSYYLSPSNELNEIEFTQIVLEEAKCDLLLDVNNVYVNSINHNYDAKSFIQAMPSTAISCGHIAGHYDEDDDLKIDTHGSAVKSEVWSLLEYAYQCHGVFPTLLERDFNIPELSEMLGEIGQISAIQNKFSKRQSSV